MPIQPIIVHDEIQAESTTKIYETRPSQLKVGDKVLATNLSTGKSQAQPVVAVLLHHDTYLYEASHYQIEDPYANQSHQYEMP